MKVTQVEVNYGRTVNMGNYESLRLDYTIRVVLDEGETARTQQRKMRIALREAVDKAIKDELDWLQGAKNLVKQTKNIGASERPKRKFTSKGFKR